MMRRLSVGLHAVSGVPKAVQSLQVAVSLGPGTRQFPLCIKRSITGAFFWTSTVTLRWEEQDDETNRLLKWEVFGHTKGAPLKFLGAATWLSTPVTKLPAECVANVQAKVKGMALSLLFSCELLPRPKLPDGTTARSITILPQHCHGLPEGCEDQRLFPLDPAASCSDQPSLWGELVTRDFSTAQIGWICDATGNAAEQPRNLTTWVYMGIECSSDTQLTITSSSSSSSSSSPIDESSSISAEEDTKKKRRVYSSVEANRIREKLKSFFGRARSSQRSSSSGGGGGPSSFAEEWCRRNPVNARDPRTTSGYL